jgi:hypothetical protein
MKKEILNRIVEMKAILDAWPTESEALEKGLMVRQEEYDQRVAEGETIKCYAILTTDGKVVDSPYMRSIKDEIEEALDSKPPYDMEYYKG